MPRSFWSQLSNSDRLAIALACLAGAMAIALFLTDKTPTSVLVLLGFMLALLVFPVIRFCRGTRARVALLVVVLIGTLLFGWGVWPKSPKIVAEATQQQQLSPPPSANGPSDSTNSGDSVAVEVRRKRPAVEFSFPTNGDRRQAIRSSVVPEVIQLEPKPTAVKESDLPTEVSLTGGSLTVLKFGKESDHGYMLFDTHELPKGTNVRGEIIGYEDLASSPSDNRAPAAPTKRALPAQTTTGSDNVQVGGSVQVGPCSNVQIGGSGNEASTNCLPPQRHLSDEQKKTLASLLRDSGVFRVVVQHAEHNFEAQTYADDFSAVLKDAGWTVTGTQVLFETRQGKGVWIMLHSKEYTPPGTAALQRSLKQIGVDAPATFSEGVGGNELWLYIGVQ